MKTKNVPKIVPVTYDEDLDSLRRANGGVPFVGIEEMSIMYMQPADTNSERDEVQHLTITSRTACAVSMDDAIKRDGFYFDITIPEGEHWSVNEGEELAALVEDFKKRLYMGVEYLNDKPKTVEE
jgi:hypothetical protein